MFRHGFCLLMLSGAYSQYSESASKPADTFSLAKSDDSRDFFEQVCKSSTPICYRDNIHLCVDGNPMNESKLVHTCLHGCTACENSPHLCNDDQGKDRCKANADRHVTSCEEDKQGTSFCSGGDVRYCNSSNLAVLVEYCDSRGCQSDPLSCQPLAPKRNRALLQHRRSRALLQNGKGSTSSSSQSSAECGKRTRVEWASMPDKDRENYVKAVIELYKNGDMQELAQLHYDNRDQIHGSGVLHFLIWHRVFLNDFEERLRALPGFECVTVPFWTYDYSTQPNDRRSLFGTENTKLGQADHNGCLGGAFASVTHTLNGSEAVCIQRTPTPSLLSSLSGATFADLAQLGEPSFPAFSDGFQNTHGLPHVAVGGALSTHFSPIDPAFFVHHSNVDRLFALWQDCHDNYEWFEPQGLQTPILAYEGVTAGDVIDISKLSWKGNTIEITYDSELLGDATRYSTDFRRRIATACEGGRLSRAARPAAPIIGIDDSWATVPSGQERPQFQMEDITLTCSSDTGTTEIARLPLTPLSVYDGLTFQDCATRCGQFYFKNSGASNCICITHSTARQPQYASFTTALSRYVPSCGSGENYGLFTSSGSTNNRRLLQQMETTTWGATLPFEMSEEASEEQEDENATDGTTIVTATRTNEDLRDNEELLANITETVQNITDDFVQNMTDDDEFGIATTDDLNATVNNTLEEWGTETDVNSTDFAESNATETNSTDLEDRVCINPIAPPAEQAAPIACSTEANRPAALPEAWMRMNNLNLDGADRCASFQPSNATRSFDCAIAWI